MLAENAIEYICILSANDVYPMCLMNRIVKWGNCTTGTCYHVDQINENIIEECTEPGTYDYFSNSVLSFVFTFSVIIAFFCGKSLAVNNINVQILYSSYYTLLIINFIFVLMLTQDLLH